MNISELKVIRTKFDDLELPEVVYKYRIWSNKFHRKMITERQVYMAPPASFEDPMDCKNFARYDLLNEDQIYSKYIELSKHEKPFLSEEEHIKLAIKNIKVNKFKDPVWIEEQKNIEFHEYNIRTGILSLTEYPLEEKMWYKYAGNFRGICIGFHARELFQYLGGGGPVKYVPKLPTIMPMPIHNTDEKHNLQVFHKLDIWSFEKEYRCTIFEYKPLSASQRKIIVPTSAFKEIIFGHKCKLSDRCEIMRITKRLSINIDFYETYFDDSGYLLKRLVQ